MSDTPAPIVDVTAIKQVARDIWVIADRRVPLVPNIGIVAGADSVLVVDCGMGPRNGARVLEAAKAIAGSRRLILTLTHFHPEHGFGAQAFKGKATLVYNSAQKADLVAKGAPYLDLFRTMGPAVVAELEGVEFVMPDVAYAGSEMEIDLGGRTAKLRTWGAAHTRGDQTIWIEDARVLFVGDLAEEKTFPIFPWFPPNDVDIDAANWVATLAACERLEPAIVVPGHGEVGGPEIPRDVGAFIQAVEKAVKASASADATAAVAELKPRLLALHPDWHFSEWIDFAIRYFLDKKPGAPIS